MYAVRYGMNSMRSMLLAAAHRSICVTDSVSGARPHGFSLSKGRATTALIETARSSWDESLRLRGGIAVSDRIALEAGYRFENNAASPIFSVCRAIAATRA